MRWYVSIGVLLVVGAMAGDVAVNAAPQTPPSAEDRMDFQLLAFLAFAVVTVVAAGAVISVRNPVHAALCLVLAFFTVACTFGCLPFSTGTVPTTWLGLRME